MSRKVTSPVGGTPVATRKGCHTKPCSGRYSRPADGIVVAYEADDINPQTRTGWSVVVTGRAHTVTDPAEVARYEQLLHPWVNQANTVVAIGPEFITGFRIIPT